VCAMSSPTGASGTNELFDLSLLMMPQKETHTETFRK